MVVCALPNSEDVLRPEHCGVWMDGVIDVIARVVNLFTSLADEGRVRRSVTDPVVYSIYRCKKESESTY